MNIGTKVHVNMEDEEWGRIAHDGTVIDIGKDGCIVNFPTLCGGADVWCPHKSIKPRA